MELWPREEVAGAVRGRLRQFLLVAVALVAVACGGGDEAESVSSVSPTGESTDSAPSTAPPRQVGPLRVDRPDGSSFAYSGRIYYDVVLDDPQSLPPECPAEDLPPAGTRFVRIDVSISNEGPRATTAPQGGFAVATAQRIFTSADVVAPNGFKVKSGWYQFYNEVIAAQRAAGMGTPCFPSGFELADFSQGLDIGPGESIRAEKSYVLAPDLAGGTLVYDPVVGEDGPVLEYVG